MVKSMGKKDPRVKAHQSYFTSNGKKVPGASTVAGYGPNKALIHWAYKQGKEGNELYAKRDIAGQIGTIAHKMIEMHLLTGEVDYDEMEQWYPRSDLKSASKAFLAYLDWEEKFQFKPIIIEQQMVSDYWGYGGTLDAYGVIKTLGGWVDGKPEMVEIPVLVDFKTSKDVYESHIYQASAYKKLLEEQKYDVDNVCILHIHRDRGVFKDHWIDKDVLQLGWWAFIARLKSLKADNEFKEVWK